jgi:hypothetical protein
MLTQMLNIKLENGNYMYKLEDKSLQDSSCAYLVPRIQSQHIPFQKWYEKNKAILDHMVSTYIDNFHGTCGSNYIIKLQTQSLELDLLKWLYHSSYNKERKWINA